MPLQLDLLYQNRRKHLLKPSPIKEVYSSLPLVIVTNHQGSMLTPTVSRHPQYLSSLALHSNNTIQYINVKN